MRLVFAGTPETALPSLRTLIDSPRHEVVAVVTRPDAQSGRGRKVHPSPVAELAEETGIEVLRPAKAGDPAFLERLRALEPDCCPVVAYGALLPQSALDVPRHGWINLHFSILPAWRGAAPVQHAVLHGDEITGASDVPDRQGARRGARLRRGHRGGPVRRHQRLAPRPAVDLRRRAPRRHARRRRGRHPAGPAAAGRRGEPRTQDQRHGRPRRLERARHARRPADPRVHAQSGRLE